MKGSVLLFVCFILLLGSVVMSGCGDSRHSAPASGSAVSGPSGSGQAGDDPFAADGIQAKAMSASPNVHKVTFRSESLDKEMRFNIYLPPEYSSGNRYPVLYLIHGYGGDEDGWMPGLGIDRTADALLKEGKITPLIIVSPEIDNSYGFNSDSMGRYGDYIVKDLVAYVDGHFSTEATRESRYIGGLSMGGWVAMHNAFRYPELYGKAGGHSPAIWLDDWADTGGLKDWLYPTEEARDQRDPMRLAQTQDLKGMSVYLDSGEEDGYKFYEGAEALYRVLQSRGVTSEYHHSPGGHDDKYWSGHAADYLLFYAGK